MEFDVDRSEAARESAIAQVDAAAPDDWKAAAWKTVFSLATRMDKFTTDDVWRALCYVPPEPRAMGAIMKRAAKKGIIEATGDFIQSVRVACHRRPLRVWRSLIR